MQSVACTFKKIEKINGKVTQKHIQKVFLKNYYYSKESEIEFSVIFFFSLRTKIVKMNGSEILVDTIQGLVIQPCRLKEMFYSQAIWPMPANINLLYNAQSK